MLLICKFIKTILDNKTPAETPQTSTQHWLIFLFFLFFSFGFLPWKTHNHQNTIQNLHQNSKVGEECANETSHALKGVVQKALTP